MKEKLNRNSFPVPCVNLVPALLQPQLCIVWLSWPASYPSNTPSPFLPQGLCTGFPPHLECPPTMTRTCLDRSHFLSLWENVTSSEGAPLFTLSALNFYLITLFLPFFHSTHLEMFAFLPFSPRLECNLHEGRDLIYLIPTPELPVFSNYQYLAVPSME